MATRAELIRKEFKWRVYTYEVYRRPSKVTFGAPVKPVRLVVYSPMAVSAGYGVGVSRDEDFRTVRSGIWDGVGASRRPKTSEIADLFEQLGGLLTSGTSLLDALAQASRAVTSPKLRGIIGTIRYLNVREGYTLSEAVSVFPEVFTKMHIALISAVEEAGLEKGSNILTDLAVRMRKDSKVWRKFYGAIAYPVFVMGLAMVAAIILELKALPPMVELFKGMGAKLPPITQFFYEVSKILTEYAILIVPSLFIIVVGTLASLPILGRMAAVQRVVTRLPLIGPIIMSLALARALTTFALLKSAGAKNREYFTLAAAAAGNAVVQDYFIQSYERVKLGDPVESAMLAERHRLTEQEGRRLGAKMELVMDGADITRIMGGYTDELIDKAESRVTLLPKAVEFPLLLCCALVVGTIIAAIFLPYPSLLADIANSMRNGS